MLRTWQYFQEGQRTHVEAVWPHTMPTAPQTLAIPWLLSQSGVTCSFTFLAHALMALTGVCCHILHISHPCLLPAVREAVREHVWGASLDIMKVFKWCWATNDFNRCAHSMSMSHWADPV